MVRLLYANGFVRYGRSCATITHAMLIHGHKGRKVWTRYIHLIWQALKSMCAARIGYMANWIRMDCEYFNTAVDYDKSQEILHISTYGSGQVEFRVQGQRAKAYND